MMSVSFAPLICKKIVFVFFLVYCSIPVYSSTSKTNEMDPKKKKKFEKEEKEFRKKFKVRHTLFWLLVWKPSVKWLCMLTLFCLFLQYNAEIKVLYQATILQSLSIKKFGNKDLPIKPGEMIDVIVHPVDDKIIGRNSEGKCELVEEIIPVPCTCTLQQKRKLLLKRFSLCFSWLCVYC